MHRRFDSSKPGRKGSLYSAAQGSYGSRGPFVQRGRATDVPVPLDLTSLKFLGKMLLVVPLLVALAAHLAEPGLLTKDKSKNQ